MAPWDFADIEGAPVLHLLTHHAPFQDQAHIESRTPVLPTRQPKLGALYLWSTLMLSEVKILNESALVR